MTTPHKHAAILRAIADGKIIQTRRCDTDAWREPKDPLDYLGMLKAGDEFRVKPSFEINGRTMSEPVREPLEEDAEYWYVCLTNKKLVNSSIWVNSEWDNLRLKYCIVHLNQEAAVDHAKALLSFTAT